MAEEKKSLIEEFKEFIDKGNAMDMAVGVTIGGAFTAIVTALTTDIINPLITLLSGGVAGEDGVAIPLTVAGFNIGSFISAIINFLLIALVVFLLVKAINKMKEAGSSVLKKEAPASSRRKRKAKPSRRWIRPPARSASKRSRKAPPVARIAPAHSTSLLPRPPRLKSKLRFESKQNGRLGARFFVSTE